MTQTWRFDPQFKIEISGETYTNDQDFLIQVTRPENNVSFAVLTVNDYKSAKYIDVFDAFDDLDVSLRYGSDSWTKVFSGPVSSAQPRLGIRGEVLDVAAWGEGNALVKTACDESYGVESVNNSAVNTPKEIIEDLIDEHINKIFGAAAATNWAITKKVDDAHAGLSVTFLDSQYLNNFVNINRLCDLANAYAQGLGPAQVSTHWYVDPSANLYFKKIDADHSDGNWDRYWGGTGGIDPGTQASSTITVAEDMILYQFRKNIEEYANHIVLSSKFRMPSEDYWTEDNGGQALWGDDGNVDLSDSATSIVGSHSLLASPNAGAATIYYYPAAQNAGWDFTKCGSEHTIPTLNFWVRVNIDKGAVGAYIRLYTQAGSHYGMYAALDSAFISAVDEWTFVSVPVGPFFMVGQDPAAKGRWVSAGGGAEDWANINWIQIGLPGDNNYDVYLDDLHFSGVVVREAKDTSEITANKTWLKVIRNDTAVNDTLTEGTPGTTDTGTAALLAYAELLRRSQTPIVGMIKIPLAPTLLPGQTVLLKACEKSDGTYRINKDFRVKELKHIIDGRNPNNTGTVLNLTDDVTNSHAFGVPTMYGLLKEYAGALGQSEARNLKGGALDNLIPRLTESY